MSIFLLYTSHTEVTVATSALPVGTSSGCAKCGTIKNSAKHSCCARGGSWFKNCGDVGDTHFAHTWIEGIQICKDFMTSISDKSSSQVMRHHVKPVVFPSNTAQSQNNNWDQKNTNGANKVISDSKGCDGTPNVSVCICVICIVLKWQM